MRHPASGYVQGINDLAAPLILVFLTEYVNELNHNNIYDLQEKDLEELENESLLSTEADVFWCLSKLVDDVQDNYIEL
jgi:TBC1 domain family member 2